MEFGASGDGGESGGGVRARLRQEKCALGVGEGGKKRSLSRMVSANVCWVGWGSVAGAGGGGEGGPGLAASPTRCARSGHPDQRGLAQLLPGSWRVSWGVSVAVAVGSAVAAAGLVPGAGSGGGRD